MSNILKRTIFQRNFRKFNQRRITQNIQTRIIRCFNDDASSSQLTEGEKYLYDKLHSKFQPTKLQVEDISGGCGSMYAIEISSKELEEARLKRQEEWKKAFERIGEKPPPIEEEYDPRTLYERLQEQKLKKEEAFQEMTRFSNLIHRLDEDEIEFLATLESEERVKELEKMKRDEEEVEKFRRFVFI
ncbi:Aim1p [Rhizophagus irregularis DAOM 197198w]|uniref:Aim1p n=1 Tax=Rhizophagus irregularis (strain DAOM 197198w) TaxID=1432141 RepID=A0A015NDR5_RHIIW|nr:Aim1p [Rhizophagus irregularis DAOM 197198w]